MQIVEKQAHIVIVERQLAIQEEDVNGCSRQLIQACLLDGLPSELFLTM